MCVTSLQSRYQRSCGGSLLTVSIIWISAIHLFTLFGVPGIELWHYQLCFLSFVSYLSGKFLHLVWIQGDRGSALVFGGFVFPLGAGGQLRLLLVLN